MYSLGNLALFIVLDTDYDFGFCVLTAAVTVYSAAFAPSLFVSLSRDSKEQHSYVALGGEFASRKIPWIHDVLSEAGVRLFRGDRLQRKGILGIRRFG